MTKHFIRKFFPLLVISLLAPWSVAYDRTCNDNVIGQDSGKMALVAPSITSGVTSTPEPAHRGNPGIPEVRNHVGTNPIKKSPLSLFVTPKDQAVEALSAQISGPRDAYQMAVQWIYVSEEKLNHAADKWLTPHEFLADTPLYPSNPLKGREVSDCEEQANTLVSLIRAEGISPEEVRVALGEVAFDDVEAGHAWVELLTNGHWLFLDPSGGPYWDGKAGKLIQRCGNTFDYYSSHTYPVLQVWTYYNDTYYLDPRYGSGNAPVSWH